MLQTKTPKCKLCGGPHYKWACFEYKRTQIQPSRQPLTYTKPPYTKSKLKSSRTPLRASQSLLKAEADRVFSRWVRISAASSFGLVTCVTCGRLDLWRNMDAGHFVSRRFNGLRFDEKNVHPQCHECNRFKHGNLKEYRKYLENRYGSGIFDYFKRRLREPTKLSDSFLQNVVSTYKMP